MDYGILTDEELLRFAYNDAATPLEKELAARLEKAQPESLGAYDGLKKT